MAKVCLTVKASEEDPLGNLLEDKKPAKKAKEEEAAARRARADELREEAAERARRNDSVAGRVKNTAISTATRQIVTNITKNLTKVISGLFGKK